MALRLIVEEREGSTQISVRLPGHDNATLFGSPHPFTPPISVTDADDLRFYMRTTRNCPWASMRSGVNGSSGSSCLRGARPCFASIFEGDERRSEAYLQAKLAVDRGEAVEVAISSKQIRISLPLPWS